VRLLFGEAWRGLRSEFAAALLSVIIVGFALYIPACLYLASQAGERYSQQIRSQVKVRVYLDENADGPFDQLQHKIQAIPGVAGVAYLDRDDLLAELEAELGSGLLTGLPGNPLPRAFDIDVTKEVATQSGLDSLSGTLALFEQVDDVVYGRAWAHRADRFFADVRFFLGIVTAILSFLVLAMASNIIRLIIRTRRESIGVWLLLGASPLYARLPYYIEGAIAGLSGAMVTLVMLYVTYVWLGAYVPSLKFLSVTETLIFLGVSVAMSLVGAVLAGRKQIVAL
jgi:cell division transport system permease protein